MTRVVVKVGTTSLTTADGYVDQELLASLAAQIHEVRLTGVQIVLVISGAIALGLREFQMRRPQPLATLQAASAVGQIGLMVSVRDALARYDLVAGQLLVSAADFGSRRGYLTLRESLEAQLKLGVVPVVNENDAVASDEIRFGDNDRIAALTSHLLSADRLILLTDVAGIYRDAKDLAAGDPPLDELGIEDFGLIVEGPGSALGSGGLQAKLSATRIAAYSGINSVIAAAGRVNVICDAVEGRPVGTLVTHAQRRESARRLWIGFAASPEGYVQIDQGAEDAVVQRGASLLRVGVVSVRGGFDAGSVVDVVGPGGRVIARGVSRFESSAIPGASSEVIHRDDLVVLPAIRA